MYVTNIWETRESERVDCVSALARAEANVLAVQVLDPVEPTLEKWVHASIIPRALTVRHCKCRFILENERVGTSSSPETRLSVNRCRTQIERAAL